MTTTDEDFYAEITPASNWAKFEKPGDKIKGVIRGRSHGKDFNGGPCAVFSIDTGQEEEVGLSASQHELKVKVSVLRPGIGDTIAVTYLRTEKIEGGKELKRFRVVLKRAGSTVIEGDVDIADTPSTPAAAVAEVAESAPSEADLL